jgi:hypothetical protein
LPSAFTIGERNDGKSKHEIWSDAGDQTSNQRPSFLTVANSVGGSGSIVIHHVVLAHVPIRGRRLASQTALGLAQFGKTTQTVPIGDGQHAVADDDERATPEIRENLADMHGCQPSRIGDMMLA